MYEKQNNKPLLKFKKKNKRKHWIMTWKISLGILKNTPFNETSFVTDSFMAEMAFC